MNVEESFFNHQNSIDHLSEEEIEQKYHYLEPVKAFARTTYTSVYIIDYLNLSPILFTKNLIIFVRELIIIIFFVKKIINSSSSINHQCGAKN